MLHSNSRLSIRFESDVGCLLLESDEHIENIFNLSLENTDREPLKLGQYCSISDAISAVAQQQTGSAEWDQLTPQQFPLRVHNIASWKFSQNLGTIPQTTCS